MCSHPLSPRGSGNYELAARQMVNFTQSSTAAFTLLRIEAVAPPDRKSMWMASEPTLCHAAHCSLDRGHRLKGLLPCWLARVLSPPTHPPWQVRPRVAMWLPQVRIQRLESFPPRVPYAMCVTRVKVPLRDFLVTARLLLHHGSFPKVWPMDTLPLLARLRQKSLFLHPM